MLFMVILEGMGERRAAFGGVFLWLISPQANFLTAFAFGVIGTISIALAGTELIEDEGRR